MEGNMGIAIERSLISNILGLFTDTGDVKVEETQQFLSLSRTEMARVFGVTSDAFREDRISTKTKQRVAELAGALEFVAEAFKGDVKKTQFWLNTPNPNFGGASPKQLILNGRYNQVLKFILASREGY
jgi:uncharacterized protein (DUF2384 family)